MYISTVCIKKVIRHGTGKQSRKVAYVALGLGAECLLDIRPDVTVARELCAELIQRLPNKHDRPICRRIEKHPVHCGQFPGDFRSLQEIFDDGFEADLGEDRISVCRDQMDMWQLGTISGILALPNMRINPYQSWRHAIAGFIHPESESCRYIAVLQCTAGICPVFARLVGVCRGISYWIEC